jgi:outer membrane autotransporter protein
MAFGAYRTLDGSADVGSSSQIIRGYGGALGFDHQIRPDLLLGFSAGGSEANISVQNLGTSGRSTGGHVGVYGVKTWGAYYLAGSVSYARLDNSTTRNIVGPGPGETATGRFDSDQLSARFELGWKRVFAHYTLTPFVAIEPAALWARGYTETSVTAGGGPGILGLTFASRTTTSLPAFLGIQADTRTVFSDGTVLTPYARVSWMHEFEPNRTVSANFVNLPATTPFTVEGARQASDAARIDAGVKFAFDSRHSFFANMSGEWSNLGQSYTATGGFRIVR